MDIKIKAVGNISIVQIDGTPGDLAEFTAQLSTKLSSKMSASTSPDKPEILRVLKKERVKKMPARKKVSRRAGKKR